MDNMELYNLIDNPLDNSEVLKKLCEVYSNSYDYHSFYKSLTNIQYSDDIVSDDNDFQVMMFNKWKKNIIDMSKERFTELYRIGQCDLDFVTLRKYLKTVSDVKSKSEIENIYKDQTRNNELSSAIYKYRWDSFGSSESWQHVCSKYVTAFKDSYPNVEHRLYLNIDRKDIYNIASSIVEKCDKYNLPYYFKYSLEDIRDDSIVMYSSTENLIKYIALLNEIKHDNPSMIERAGKPPLLTGNINNWIGYGSEPDMSGNSFNSIRSKIIGPAMDKVTNVWLKNNKSSYIKYDNKNISIKDFLSLKSTEDFVESFENYYRLYGDECFYRQFNFKFGELSCNSILTNIYNSVRQNMDNILDENNDSEFQINLAQGVNFTSSKSFVNHSIRKLAPVLIEQDPTYCYSIKNQIEKDACEYGIDTTKFCFDTSRVNRMRVLDNKNELIRPRERKINESDSEYEKYLEVHYNNTFSKSSLKKVR